LKISTVKEDFYELSKIRKSSDYWFSS